MFCCFVVLFVCWLGLWLWFSLNDFFDARLAQWIAYQTSNLGVAGSSPASRIASFWTHPTPPYTYITLPNINNTRTTHALTQSSCPFDLTPPYTPATSCQSRHPRSGLIAYGSRLEAVPLFPPSAQTGRFARGLGFAVIGDCGLCFATDVYFNSEFVPRLLSVGSFGSFVFLLIMVCFGLDCIAAPFRPLYCSSPSS